MVISVSVFTPPPSQCGAENGGKRKKDRNLDELKKEVALVRETGCHRSIHSPVRGD